MFGRRVQNNRESVLVTEINKRNVSLVWANSVSGFGKRATRTNNGNLPVAPLLLVHFFPDRVDAGVVGKREGLAAARGFLEPSLVLDHQRVEFLRNSLAVLLRKAIHDSASDR